MTRYFFIYVIIAALLTACESNFSSPPISWKNVNQYNDNEESSSPDSDTGGVGDDNSAEPVDDSEQAENTVDRSLRIDLQFDNNLDNLAEYVYEHYWIGTPSYDGGALDLAGTNSYVLFPHNDDFGGMNSISITVVCRVTGVPEAANLAVLKKYQQYEIRLGEDQVYASIMTDESGNVVVDTYNYSEVNNSDWHTIKADYDGEYFEVFVDDISIGKKQCTGTVLNRTEHDLYIGKDPWGDSFCGQIDSVVLSW
ncbi:MAG: hypothetical protein JXK07_16240 [Spirochaetes bacterium]|nr:hypothetical protein [Spirochaetota bacterium]MBN2770638.1 hypothetical protein [Spirochaetota bacterium]